MVKPKTQPIRWSRHWWWIQIRNFSIAYLGVCLVLYWLQHRLTYFPSRELLLTPADVGLPFEDVRLPVRNGQTIHAWYVPHPAARGAALWCHGNGGNMSHRLDTLRLLHEMGLAVSMFDYRGYGQSDGEPGEHETYEDAAAAWRFMTEERGHAPAKSIVWGRSLGGAVAVNLASQVNPAGLIVESTFTSLPDVGSQIYPWLPVRLICRIKYDSARHVPNLRIPKLFVHSPEDDIIPYQLGRQLFELAAEPKAFVETRGDHNRGWLDSRELYTEPIVKFVDGLLTD